MGKSAWLFLCLACLFCLNISCSNRKDFIATLDSKPSIRLRYGDSLYRHYQDSVKIRPDLNNYSVVDLVFTGSDGITALQYNARTANGQLYYKNQPVSDSLLNPENGETILRYNPMEEGTQVFKFIVLDKFRASDTAVLSVLCFKNLPPLPSFEVEPIRRVDPLEYSLNASKSYDQDQHFGGNISSYIFNVQGQTLTSDTPMLNYIFPAPGKYDISLQVVDNDGARSQTYSQTVLVN